MDNIKSIESKIKENFLPNEFIKGIEEVLLAKHLNKDAKLKYLGKVFNQISETIFEGEFVEEQILHLNYVREYIVRRFIKDDF